MKSFGLPAFTRSARFRLVLLVLLSVIPALTLAIYSGLDYRHQAADHARSEAETAARLTSDSFERLLSSAEQLLVSLAQLPQVRERQAAGCSAFLADLQKQFPVYSNLAAAAPDGSVFCSAMSTSAPVSIADRSYFQQVLNTHRLAVSDFLIDRFSHISSVVLAYPALDAQGRTQAVVIVSINLDALSQAASTAQLPEGSVFVMLDGQGNVLIRNPDPQQTQGQPYTNLAVRQAALASQQPGSLEATGTDGVPRLFAYLPLSSTPAGSAYIIIGFPTSRVYSEADGLLQRNLIGLAVVALLALAAAWILGDALLLRQVREMLAAAHRWAAGDLAARAHLQNGSTEIVQLGHAFDEMAEAIQQREGRLRLAEARYRGLVEQIPVITYTATMERPFAFTYISPQIEAFLGVCPPALTGPGAPDWIARVHPDDRARFQQAAARFPLEEETFLLEYRICSAADRTLWVHNEARQLTGETGGTVVVQGILQDVTARKEAEAALTARTKELARSNRELQDFVYIASHDLQEPLRKIQAFGERLQAVLQDRLDEKSGDYITRMTGAAARMQSMINDLLSYSRVTTRAQPPTPVDLNQVASEVLSDLEVSVERSHGRVDLAPLPWVLADAPQMHGLLQNLIGNALKFHPTDQAPVVRVYAEPAGETGPDGEPCVHIIVADNGIGFDEKYLERIFQPFQRLHGRSEYEGSGIGLAICAKIAEQQGGKITAHSAPGQGAAFIVTLKTCSGK
jgi:PAS domain S-box-containing protein